MVEIAATIFVGACMFAVAYACWGLVWRVGLVLGVIYAAFLFWPVAGTTEPPRPPLRPCAEQDMTKDWIADCIPNSNVW